MIGSGFNVEGFKCYSGSEKFVVHDFLLPLHICCFNDLDYYYPLINIQMMALCNSIDLQDYFISGELAGLCQTDYFLLEFVVFYPPRRLKTSLCLLPSWIWFNCPCNNVKVPVVWWMAGTWSRDRLLDEAFVASTFIDAASAPSGSPNEERASINELLDKSVDDDK